MMIKLKQIKSRMFFRIAEVLHIIAAFLLISSHSFSQTLKTETVSVLISARDFETPLPFDVPFKIKGTAEKKIQKIAFSYRIKNRKENDWYYFPPLSDLDSLTAFSKEETWTRIDDDSHFAFHVGELHPNVPYEFKFTLLVSITLEKTQSDALKTELLTMLHTTLDDINFTLEDLERLTENIQAKLSSVTARGKLTDIDQKEFKLEPLEPPLKTISDNLINVNQEVLGSKERIAGSALRIIGLSQPAHNGAFSMPHIINALRDSSVRLNASIARTLYQPLNPTIKGFETYTLRDFLVFYSNTLNNPSILAEILKGEAKINGSSISSANSHDMASLQLLLSFYERIGMNTFVDTGNRFIFLDYAETLEELKDNVTILMESIKTIQKRKEELDNLKTAFPDVLQNVFVQQSLNIIEESAIDVTSQNTPYIGLDAGIVYGFMLGNVFLYQGANIYLKPVNKKAPLGKFEGWDKFTKIFSLYVGVTQKVAGPEDASYKPLFDGAGSLLTGFGFRFNRIARLNVGALFYQYKNPNPVVDKYYLRCSPTISLSFDINIVTALGAVGKLF